MSGQCSLCSAVYGLECSGDDNCFFLKYGLREKMMEDDEYFVSFKNLIDNVYHRSMDLFQFQTQLTCYINSHIMGAQVAAAQFSAAQAAEAVAQAAASVVQAAASVVQVVVQAVASVVQAVAQVVVQAAAQVAAQASTTVADQEAATVGADQVVNESAGITFWNKTKACFRSCCSSVGDV